ncbi:phosphotransferase enzyme family protein [Allorhizocola rhizosphaerae]|uniref:phosphotransferase enzyme family protein n=1 Tax=Allorhizocola rhizosphaerae TaxID=1872709 RepID=UPI000E3DF65F|nr:phosphotransferase [Allorhizocola rhizosphaerae]
MNLDGNVTSGLERVGDTLRRPAGPWTEAVDALLKHLHDVGFEGAPRPLGRDARGRQVLEFVPGDVGDERGTYSDPELASIGRMLAELHQALASFTPPTSPRWHVMIPPDRQELVCHNDVAPWNLVRTVRGWVLIDWDNAGPSSRLWDLAYAAQAMCGLRADRPVPESKARLSTFLNGYGLPDDQRPALTAMLGRRARAMYEILSGAQQEPWSRIFTEDGPYWRSTAEYLEDWST